MEQDVRLKLNAKLQSKKNALRKALADKGILPNGCLSVPSNCS